MDVSAATRQMSFSRKSELVEVLRGVVSSGSGDLNRWMTLYAAEYRAASGMELYPGSLNVVLERPWRLPAQRVTIEPERVGRLVHLVPCRVGGRRGFVFRTEKAELAGGEEHRVLELLAEVRLRDALGVSDGDVVEVVIDDVPIGGP